MVVIKSVGRVGRTVRSWLGRLVGQGRGKAPTTPLPLYGTAPDKELGRKWRNYILRTFKIIFTFPRESYAPSVESWYLESPASGGGSKIGRLGRWVGEVVRWSAGWTAGWLDMLATACVLFRRVWGGGLFEGCAGDRKKSVVGSVCWPVGQSVG